MYAQDVLEGSGPAYHGDGTHHGGEATCRQKTHARVFNFAELRRNTKISYVISWYKIHVGWRRLHVQLYTHELNFAIFIRGSRNAVERVVRSYHPSALKLSCSQT